MPVLLKKATLEELTDRLVAEGVEKGVAKAAVAQALKASLMEGAPQKLHKKVSRTLWLKPQPV